MKFPRQAQQGPSINMTPVLDCVFLLLLFFAVSATFRHGSQLALVLPTAQGVEVEQASQQINVAVSADGHYSVNGKLLTASSTQALSSALKSFGDPDSSTRLVISADANATHQAVVNVMDAAGKLGFVNVNILTVKPKEKMNGG